ncbi:MAG: hypothetical protein J7L69_00175 [Desulfobulbaceae bacterium]|nr:hypothetical protein [Desulfobulbaceae bacterium]
MIPLFYTLNGLLLLSGLLGLRLHSGDRRFAFSLVQTLLGLPLLAGEYHYLAHHLETRAIQVILFSEIIFALIWLSMALRLRDATVETVGESRRHVLIEISVGAVVTAVAGYFLAYRPVIEISDSIPAFHNYSPVYFSAVFILATVLYAFWRLEQFWRVLNSSQRWEYRFLVAGSCLVCGTLVWSASYRLTYLVIIPRHLHLLSGLLLSGWILMLYAVVRHQLLNRKIFVSRKVVYSFVVPSLLAAYLLGFGLLSLTMRTFGLEMSFVLKWLFVILGVLAVGLFASSGKIRSRVHFFISTHFYVNKYEYRDEWLALSQHLQGALTETDVVKALRQVLAESLYTTKIFIWLGDLSQGYRLVSSPENPDEGSHEKSLSSDDPLIRFILTHSYFHRQEKEPNPAWQQVVEKKEAFLSSLDLTLLAPLSIGNQLVGLFAFKFPCIPCIPW